MRSNVSECLTWKLDQDEYSINQNGTVTEIYRNVTFSNSEYILNNKSELFVCVPTQFQPPFYYMDLVYTVEWIISCIFLIKSVMIHCSKSNFVANRALVCHEISLIAFYLTGSAYAVGGPSKISFYFDHYFQTYIGRCAFCWLVIINYDKWKQLRPENIHKISTSTLTFCLQSLFSWCVPALIIGGTLALQCFGVKSASADVEFHQNLIEEIFFYTTTEFILVVNIALFILTVRNLRRYGKLISRANRRIFKQLSAVYLKLMVVTGVIWIFSVMEWALVRTTPSDIWVGVELISSLQGFFIYVVYHVSCEMK